MAVLTGPTQLFGADTSIVSTTLVHPLGTRARDADGNEYVYLTGVASTAAGSWVSFDEDNITLLLTANAVGRVGIAMAAIVASSYGWYQIYGKNTIAVTDTVAADKQLYIDGTAGRADDAVVSGDMIVGAISRSADTSNVATVELCYPFVTDVLG